MPLLKTTNYSLIIILIYFTIPINFFTNYYKLEIKLRMETS